METQQSQTRPLCQRRRAWSAETRRRLRLSLRWLA